MDGPSKKHLLKEKYHWTADRLFDCFRFSCFAYVELTSDYFFNPKLSNRRSALQWYFPFLCSKSCAFLTDQSALFQRSIVFLKVGHSRPLLIYFRHFKTVDNKQMLNKILPMTADLWYRKRTLYQLSHNHKALLQPAKKFITLVPALYV